MNNREYNLFTVAAVALAICGAALLMMPVSATSEASGASAAVTTAAAGEVGYLPAQYVNQAVEIQPLPEQF